MKMNRSKYLWNILLIVSITVVAMYFALRDNFTLIMDSIARMNPFMLVMVLAWGLVYTAVWGIGFQIMGRRYIPHYTLLDGIEVSFVGSFFAGITPSSTGGQFGQIYVLKKQGIKMSDGASLLWADFIIYQTAMMIYVTILFALRFAHYANLSAWFWMVFVGYLVNLVVIIGLYTMAIFPSACIRVASWVGKLLKKIHFIKNPDQIVDNLVTQVENFTVEIKKLSDAREMIIKCLLVNLLRLTLYYSLPYVIARAVGIPLKMNQLVDVMALSSFVSMANSFIPLPGASGSTEVMFTLMFSGMLGKLTGAVLLLWRVSSYYVPVIAGALTFIYLKNKYDRNASLQSLAMEQALEEKRESSQQVGTEDTRSVEIEKKEKVSSSAPESVKQASQKTGDPSSA